MLNSVSEIFETQKRTAVQTALPHVDADLQKAFCLKVATFLTHCHQNGTLNTFDKELLIEFIKAITTPFLRQNVRHLHRIVGALMDHEKIYESGDLNKLETFFAQSAEQSASEVSNQQKADLESVISGLIRDLDHLISVESMEASNTLLC